MTGLVHQPNIEKLLPPFLAHVPIAFSSPNVPPSLFPLLAPILRSRVRLLAGGQSSGANVSETWIALLTWSRNGDALARKFASQDFQPHPSGEIEIGDYDLIGIRRADEETLLARVALQERGVEIIYVWVPEDEEGSGWKITDIKVLDENGGDAERRASANNIIDGYLENNEDEWHSTIAKADQAFSKEKNQTEGSLAGVNTSKVVSKKLEESLDEEDDDSYWGMYDQTPSRSPAVNHSPTRLPTEEEYFARYADASPALEPPETPLCPYTIDHDAILKPPLPHSISTAHTTTTYGPITAPISPPTSSPRSKPVSKPSTPIGFDSNHEKVSVSASPGAFSPRPTSPTSSSSGMVTRLENQASVAVQTEAAIKHHISTQLKSLYRLAKSACIDQEEFKRIVSTEMDILSMVDEDDESSGEW